MYAIFFVGISCFVQPAPIDALPKQLEAEFRELHKAEGRSRLLRRATAVLEQPDPDGSAFQSLLAQVREARSRAAIPLVLLSLHNSRSRSKDAGIQDHVDELVILTGEDVPVPIGDAKEAAAYLLRKWWQPNKAKITTDIGKMSPQQVDLIVQRLVTNAESWRFHPGRVEGVSEKLKMLFHPHLGGRELAVEDLHPAMLPAMLSLAGYNPKGPPAADRDTAQIPYGVIPMLAHLRNEGEAPELDKIADDKTQNSAVRLNCVLALHAAGEDVRTETVLEILAKEKVLERRQIAIWILRYARNNKLVVPALAALLDDANAQVRGTALESLQGRATREILPKLKQLLNENRNPYTELDVIAAMQTQEANQVLADYLSACLKDPARGDLVKEALYAFERGTGRRWMEPGVNDNGYYREKSLQALKWWEMNNDAKK